MRFALLLTTALCIATPAFAQDSKPSFMDKLKGFTESLFQKEEAAPPVEDAHDHMQHGAVEADAESEVEAVVVEETVITDEEGNVVAIETEIEAVVETETVVPAEDGADETTDASAIEETPAAEETTAVEAEENVVETEVDGKVDAEIEAEVDSKVEAEETSQETKATETPSFSVKDARAYATAKSQTTGAVFMTIENKSDTEYRVMGATTDLADSVELHSMKMVDGKMVMRPEPELVIPPSGTLALDPQGYHIMLVGLKEPLEKGDKFPLRVIISGGNNVDVEVKIVKAGS
jgi:copper(I)-binding protein